MMAPFGRIRKSRNILKRFSTPEPQVFFTNKEVMAAPKEITEGCRTTAYKYYGVSYMEKNTIFINVKKSLMRRLWKIQLYMN